jgi:hypothetical protein
MTEAELRARICDVLCSLNVTTEAALRRELAEPIDLGHSERLQFEACPHFFGIKMVQTEEEIISDSAIREAVPEELWAAAETADISVFEAIEAELPAWLGERWRSVGGPHHYRPAYLVYHGGLDEPLYDLENDRWCEVSEVWPEES